MDDQGTFLTCPICGTALQLVQPHQDDEANQDAGSTDAPMQEQLKCPMSKGPMKARRSAHGPFWGCAAYPRCTGTRDQFGRSRNERRNP